MIRFKVKPTMSVAERSKAALLANARKRAAEQRVPFNLKRADLDVPTHCPALGLKLEAGERGGGDSSPTIDRLIPERGYVRGNIAILSMKANRMKNSGTSAELRAIADWLDTVLCV